jgi:hypothetical protein
MRICLWTIVWEKGELFWHVWGDWRAWGLLMSLGVIGELGVVKFLLPSLRSQILFDGNCGMRFLFFYYSGHLVFLINQKDYELILDRQVFFIGGFGGYWRAWGLLANLGVISEAGGY